MKNKAVKVYFDRKATRERILKMAKDKGITATQFDRTVNDIALRMRQVTGKKRLYEIERYMVMAQILDKRLDDLFVVVRG